MSKTAFRSESHLIKDKETVKMLDRYAFEAKNLYNKTNFYLRQCASYGSGSNHEQVIKTVNYINEMAEKYNDPNRKGRKGLNTSQTPLTREHWFPCKNFIKWMMRVDENEEFENPYGNLHSQSSQGVVLKLHGAWSDTFKAMKAKKENPKKFKGKIDFPKYKHKEKGRKDFIATSNKSIPEDGIVKLPKIYDRLELKTDLPVINQIEIVKKNHLYKINLIYKVEIDDLKLDKNKAISIDLGINNFAAVSNNFNEPSFIINGKQIKSINQYYNKKQSRLKSYVGGKGTSNKLNKLHMKRNNMIADKMHKASKLLIDYCIENNVGKVIIGYNKTWKQKSDMGKKTNQKFVSIPYLTFKQKLQYKCEAKGIEFVEVNESHTSKTDALALEGIKNQKNFLGNRKHRGLFESSEGYQINADINGSLNIMRKVIGDDFIKELDYKNLTPTIIDLD